MELKPTNSNPESDRPASVDSFGQPTNTREDETHLGTTPADSTKAHYRADTDSSKQALHHTLGSGRNQAAPGDHNHDGTTSGKLGKYAFDSTVGQEGKVVSTLSISGSRGGNAAVASIIALLGNFIDFKDNTTA